ncbi:MAG TPA: MFS transporter, partial [Bacteroidales bacterium]|nr:MFS transporter [Bacteroidales bacterium]
WNETKSDENEPLTDSLIYLTAKVTTSTPDSFKMGVYNPQNNKYFWFTFPKGADTLGLHRNGATSDVQIRLSKIASVDNLTNPASLKIVVSKPASAEIKFADMAIKEINYRSGIQKAATIIAIIAVVFFLLTFAWTRERIKPIVEKSSLKDDLNDLGKNIPWFILLGAGISTIFFNTIRDSAAVYYFTYYYKGPGNIALGTNVIIAISTIYLLLGQAANMLGVILAKPLSDKIGKKNTFMYAMVIASALSIIFYFIDRSNITMIYSLQILISISAGIIFPMLWSMYADSADYSEWKNGRRATGLVFSAASMSQKFGASIGIYLVAILLELYGYKAGVDQTPITQQGIRMMLSIYPAIGALLAAFFMFIYPLKESLLTKIETELDERRKLRETSNQ